MVSRRNNKQAPVDVIEDDNEFDPNEFKKTNNKDKLVDINYST